MTLVPCIVPRGGDHCDFCCTSPVVTLYACTNFLIAGRFVYPSGRAVGSWATCRACADLVDAGKWNDLTNRAFKKLVKRHHASADAMVGVREQLAEVHHAFAKHMFKKC
jgi:hypothetical protein